MCVGQKLLYHRGTKAVTLIGSFSKDDGDGNEDVKKNNRFVAQNKNFARASRFFVHFFTALGRLPRENA